MIFILGNWPKGISLALVQQSSSIMFPSRSISKNMSIFTITWALTFTLLLANLINTGGAEDKIEAVQLSNKKGSVLIINDADSFDSRHMLDHEREDEHKENNDNSKQDQSKHKDHDDDNKLHEDAEDMVEDVDDFLHKVQKSKKGNLGFVHALIASLSVIIVSELGDKTFFIAAILAMRHSRLTVLAGALSALFVMTIMSALVGFATTVIPRAFTYYASSILFAVFGIKMLREAWTMSADEGQEEYDECQAEIKKKEDEMLRMSQPQQDIETGIIRTPGRRFWTGIVSAIFLESFTLTFLAEWGDRSQIATIILGAREDVVGVIIGGLIGHALCTGLAVLGGRFVAQRISIRTVTFVGGIVFLVFAASALIFSPDS